MMVAHLKKKLCRVWFCGSAVCEVRVVLVCGVPEETALVSRRNIELKIRLFSPRRQSRLGSTLGSYHTSLPLDAWRPCTNRHPTHSAPRVLWLFLVLQSILISPTQPLALATHMGFDTYRCALCSTVVWFCGIDRTTTIRFWIGT